MSLFDQLVDVVTRNHSGLAPLRTVVEKELLPQQSVALLPLKLKDRHCAHKRLLIC